MSGIATAIAVTGIGGALLSSSAQRSAAESATASQDAATRLGIEEQRRQFDKLQEVLAPFTEAGTGAIGAQGALTGLGGPEAMQQAIAGIEAGPEFEALTRQAQEGILQGGSATGGLRGGNVQGALAQFRPQILSQLINQRFGRLGQISQLGQASAAGVGAGALQTGANISNLELERGRVGAEGALARGANTASTISDITRSIGTFAGSF